MSPEYYTFISASVQSWTHDIALRTAIAPYFREFLEFGGHVRIAAQLPQFGSVILAPSKSRPTTDIQRSKSRIFNAAHSLATFWRRVYSDETTARNLRIQAFSRYLACVELMLRNSIGGEGEVENACAFVGLARTNDWLCGQNFWDSQQHRSELERLSDSARARAPILELLIDAPTLVSTNQIAILRSAIAKYVINAEVSEYAIGQLLERCSSGNFGKDALAQARALRSIERPLLQYARNRSYLVGWADLLLLKTKYGDRRISLPELQAIVTNFFPAAHDDLVKYLNANSQLTLRYVQLGRVEYLHRVSMVFTCKNSEGKLVILKQSFFANSFDLELAFRRERQVYETKRLDFAPKVYAIDVIGSSKFLVGEKFCATGLHARLHLANSGLRQTWRLQLREILSSLEKCGVVHGDISTRNLLVRKDNLVLIDFESAECVSANFDFAGSQDRIRAGIVEGYL